MNKETTSNARSKGFSLDQTTKNISNITQAFGGLSKRIVNGVNKSATDFQATAISNMSPAPVYPHSTASHSSTASFATPPRQSTESNRSGSYINSTPYAKTSMELISQESPAYNATEQIMSPHKTASDRPVKRTSSIVNETSSTLNSLPLENLSLILSELFNLLEEAYSLKGVRTHSSTR